MNIKEKVQDAIKDMHSKVAFDHKKHIYINNETGEYLQGVSTVSSIVPKDWLAAWGAKEAVKALGFSDYNDHAFAEQMWDKIKKCKDVKQYHNILQEAKSASRKKSDKALLDGKRGHAWLEEYVKAKIDDTPIPPIPDGPLARPIQQFLEWERNNVAFWIASEARVAYPEKLYAGTLDAIAMTKEDGLALIDFKFATHIGEDYYLQTAGYAATFEPYDIHFDSRIIIRLPKTLEKDEWDAKHYQYFKVENRIEIHKVPTDYTVDRDTFFHCLPVKQWINYVTTINK